MRRAIQAPAPTIRPPRAASRPIPLSALATSMFFFSLPGLTVYYDATFGRGISSYLQDDYEGNLDASSCIDWSMRLIGSLGLTAGFSYEFSDKVCINANYSRVSNYADDEAPLSGDSYRYGDYVAANLVYRINRIVQVAMEYDYGKRKSFDGTSLHVNRMQAQLAVTF